MSKVELDLIISGYNLSKINNNFQKLEDELNNKTLYRKHGVGEPNHMEVTLDMDSNDIINVKDISVDRLFIDGEEVIPEELVNEAALTALNEFKEELASSSGSSEIGFIQAGTGAQLRTVQNKLREPYVSPEDYGAIGDGTIHPLSERFTTLAEAQAVYPHVTALTQTIDWAACQAAENYARGVTKVVPRPFASYRFGHDGLQLAELSWWDTGFSPQNDKPGVTMTREVPLSLPTFGQCYVARVIPAPMGAADVFQRGIIFKGIKLRYPVARRTPVKSTNSICFHGGNAIQSEIDISCVGAEYGLYAWSFWGNRGRVRVDSCHKGYFVVPNLSDPERVGGGTTTSNQFDIRCDVTPFPITIGTDSYSQYTGYFEGSVASDGNYDSANETACGITIIGAPFGIRFDLGVEKWEGVLINRVGAGLADAGFRFGFFPDAHYRMSTGNDGSDAAMRALIGQSASRIQLPPSQRALLNASGGDSSFTFYDSTLYIANAFTETSSTRYLCNINNPNGRFNFVGGNTAFTPEPGAAPIAFSINESMKSRVTVVGCRSMDLWCSPNTDYRLIARNLWRKISVGSVAGTKVAEGQYADFAPPSTPYKVVNVEGLTTNLGNTGSAITHRPSLFSYDDGTKSMRAGTSYTGAAVLNFSGYQILEQG